MMLRTKLAHPGAAPGTLIVDPDALAPEVHVIAYSPDEVVERDIAEVSELGGVTGVYPVTWINVDGLGDIETVRWLGERFGIHRLALEDVLNVLQRPKAEEYDSHTYIVVRAPQTDGMLETEQVSVFLGDSLVLTFQERPGDFFEPVRDRIRSGRGRIRRGGADYLAYALIDATVDSYYPVIETYGEVVETLEQEILENPGPHLISEIHGLKRNLLTFRRAVWSLREMVNSLLRDSSPRISENTQLYLRDCYDHTVQLLDMVETYREIASGLVDLHFSSVSTRMNEIMKLLTIIATIFIPLGFIAGVYGMNFDPAKSPLNMPELSWYWGYPFSLGLMAAVAAGLVWYFRRRGWL